MRAKEFTNFKFEVRPFKAWSGQGIMVTAYDGKEVIGQATFEPTDHDTKLWYSTNTEVEEPYQRQGIATKMYDLAKQKAANQGANIVPSHARTDDARGLWGDKKVWEQQVNEYNEENTTEEYHGLHMKIRDDGHEVITTALDDWGNEMGSVVFMKGDDNELDPQDLLVIDKYRGLGVAKVMYDFTTSHGYEIHKSYDVTKMADQGKQSGEYFWKKNRGEKRIWETSNPATVLSAEQVWDYVGGIHPADQQGGGFLKSLIMLNPQYILKRVPLSSLHIPNDEDEGNDPYNRGMFVDVDHAREYSQYQVDKKPLVVDSQGHILDGAHRAWAASELLGKKDILAYVPVTHRDSSPQDLEIRKKFI